jgi:CubicO group peptidase (beta-lactamase class C family)
MDRRARLWILVAASAALIASLPVSGAAPTSKPEDVGLSTDRLQQVTALMRRHIEAKSFAGAVTLVARNGRVAYLQAHGLADLDTKQAMKTDSIFRIMSMTKPVVGAAILMMMEEGKVRLNDPVSRFIPALKGMQVAVAQPAQGAGAPGAPADPRYYTVPADHEMTVRELLSHTSGLVSGPMSNSANRKVILKGTESLSEYLPRLASTPLEFQPGTRWSYSAQAGFDVLLHIVEIASGQPADVFLKQRIFDPLGMKDIAFWPTETQWPRVASVYQRGANGLTRQTPANDTNSRGIYFRASGGLYSTAEDYIPLGVMLANMGEFSGKHLLSRKTVEMMTAAHVPDTLPGRAAGEGYGLSVRVVTDHTRRGTMLSDGTYGWSGAQGTHFFVDPKEKLVGVLMVQTSIGEMQRDFEELVAGSVIR